MLELDADPDPAVGVDALAGEVDGRERDVRSRDLIIAGVEQCAGVLPPESRQIFRVMVTVEVAPPRRK